MPFLAMPDKPTAAVCWSDLVAIGFMNGLARAGFRPGVDISVTGYDDLEESAIATPALSTVWNGQRDVGHRAARALLDRANREGREGPAGADPTRTAHPPDDRRTGRALTHACPQPAGLLKPSLMTPIRNWRRPLADLKSVTVLLPGNAHPQTLARLEADLRPGADRTIGPPHWSPRNSPPG